MSFCSFGSVASTTLPGRPRSPMSSTSRASFELRVAIVAGELDEQDRCRLAADEARDDRRERLVAAGEPDHRAVDQLDRVRVELDDVLRALHRPAEGGEMAHAERLVTRDRRELQRQLPRPRESAFGADEEAGEVVRHHAVGRRAGLHHVDVVALHPPQHLRPARGDLRRLAPDDRVDLADQRAVAWRSGSRSRRSGRSGIRIRRRAPRRSRVRCGPCCRSGSSASRRSCCRPCRRSSPAPRSRRRPGTRGRAAAGRRSGGRARCRAGRSPSR